MAQADYTFFYFFFIFFSNMSIAKNWCFTLNNPTTAETERLLKLEDLDAVRYLIFQLEMGVRETCHYQGYIQLKSKKRMAQVKDIVGERAHLEVAKGSAEQNKQYCSKRDGRLAGPWEFGSPTTKGKRSDLCNFVDEIRENPLMKEKEILEKFPDIFAKYPRFIKDVRRIYNTPEGREEFQPRQGWQTTLNNTLLSEADRRKVNWYWEPIGCVGKSFFALNFRDGKGRRGYVVTGGRHADIFYAYDRETTVFFDWTRDNKETIPYSVIESFKNGYFLSTKYESVPITFNIPHVVVFANYPPDQSKLSSDRWNIVEI